MDRRWIAAVCFAGAVAGGLSIVSCGDAEPAWAAMNPIEPLPAVPLGAQVDFAQLADSEPKLKVTPEKVRLGRLLFFDTRLSADSTVSCATCHRPENAFSEPTKTSTGINNQVGGRKAPTVINLANPIYPNYFWDGRAGSLAEQAKGPIENPIEMGNTHEKVEQTLAGIQGYRDLFVDVYGNDTITIDLVADAIAAYEATRLSGNSPYDRWKKARDDSLVDPKVVQGDKLFHDKAMCNQCHLSWNFTDSLFHNLGVGWDAEAVKFRDDGRKQHTGDDKDTGAFKTPGLRNLAARAPYMHDGSIATLREVIDLYNKGGEANPWLSDKIKPLELTEEEIDCLLAFMEALEGTGFEDTAPTEFPK